MSICLYVNGIIEEFKAKELIFSDKEILDLFLDCEIIKTKRLLDIPNTWCIWGEKKENFNDEFSGIASNIINGPVYSILIFVHDSELDPSWMLTDNIIYKNYDLFKQDLMLFIDHIAKMTIQQQHDEKVLNGTVENKIILNTRGSTKDKRILFEFVLAGQNKNFFDEEIFINFAWKVTEYLDKIENKNNADENLFYLYEDAKMIMYVQKTHASEILSNIIEFYEKTEKYENCQKVQLVLNKLLDDERNKT